MAKPKEKRSAYAEAARLLARRPRTRHELAERLAAEGHVAEEADAALDRLQDDGYVDDFGLARDFIVARCARLRHSRQRLLDDLETRGVDVAVAEAAWRDADEAGEVDPRKAVRGQVERYLVRAGGRFDVRKYHRVYNALLRAGHDQELVDAELAACRPSTDRNP